jgi:DNA polymerase III delta subunit
MAVKKITTCLDQNLWREAILANVSWTEAMKAGVKLFIGNSLEEDELKKRKMLLEGEIRHIQKKLNQISKQKKLEDDLEETVMKHLDLIEKATPLIMEDIKRLKAWTRTWINKTNLPITEDAFFQICKRFKDGDFGDKK